MGVDPSQCCQKLEGGWGGVPAANYPNGRGLARGSLYSLIQFTLKCNLIFRQAGGRPPAPPARHLPSPSALAPSHLTPLLFPSSAQAKAFLRWHPPVRPRSGRDTTGGADQHQLIFDYD